MTLTPKPQTLSPTPPERWRHPQPKPKPNPNPNVELHPIIGPPLLHLWRHRDVTISQTFIGGHFERVWNRIIWQPHTTHTRRKNCLNFHFIYSTKSSADRGSFAEGTLFDCTASLLLDITMNFLSSCSEKKEQHKNQSKLIIGGRKYILKHAR